MASATKARPVENGTKVLKIKDIKRDGGTQSRVDIDQEMVTEFSEEMKAGKRFPPVFVFLDGKEYFLADGFHRLEAAIQAGLDSIGAVVINGSLRDAILFAAGANAEHGMRRTNEDKRNAVTKLLHDQEWRKWSDAEIARKCRVSDTFVGGLRKELSPNGSEIAPRMAVRNGNPYPMKTGNIGTGKPADTSSTTHGVVAENIVENTAENDVEADAKTPQEETAVDEETSVPSGQSTSTSAKSAISEGASEAHAETAGHQVAPLPSHGSWSTWKWVPISIETTFDNQSNAILVTIPGTMAVNKSLRAFVEQACKLNCAVFATPALEELVVESTRSSKKNADPSA